MHLLIAFGIISQTGQKIQNRIVSNKCDIFGLLTLKGCDAQGKFVMYVCQDSNSISMSVDSA